MAVGLNNIGNWGNPYAGAYVPGSMGAVGLNGTDESGGVGKIGMGAESKAGQVTSKDDCETCSSRKYQDGSDEMVSFKSPTHISPEAAPTAVRAHEQEHVSNAYKKAAMEGGEVVYANISIHMSICSECGRSYVAGGETATKIKYPNEENPYQKFKKQQEAMGFTGMNFDEAG